MKWFNNYNLWSINLLTRRHQTFGVIDLLVSIRRSKIENNLEVISRQLSQIKKEKWIWNSCKYCCIYLKLFVTSTREDPWSSDERNGFESARLNFYFRSFFSVFIYLILLHQLFYIFYDKWNAHDKTNFFILIKLTKFISIIKMQYLLKYNKQSF